MYRNDERRARRLAEMGIERYMLRGSGALAAATPVLLLVADAAAQRTRARLTGDLARCLRGCVGGAEVKIAEAASSEPGTGVLGGIAFGVDGGLRSSGPAVAAARWIDAPSLAVLAGDAAAKRTLWRRIRRLASAWTAEAGNTG
jgi:hypothetical protein